MLSYLTTAVKKGLPVTAVSELRRDPVVRVKLPAVRNGGMALAHAEPKGMYHRSVDRSISRRELLQLGLLPALPSPAEAPQTSRPLTYVIDYAMDHLDRLDACVREVAAAAPNLLHLGHDTPFKGGPGPRRAPEPLGGAQAARYPLLSPAATREYLQALKRIRPVNPSFRF